MNEDITLLLKQYNSMMRYSYNRFLEGKTEKDIRLLSKSLNNINSLNSWLIQCSIRDAKSIYNRFREEKVIFGSKVNFIKRIKNKISKEKYQLNRLNPINI